MKIVPLEEHQMLVFWVQLLALVGMARLLGGVLRRFGQPAVVGELAAGVVLGPSVLGRLWPAGAAWLFPPTQVQSGLLLVVGTIGITLLLVMTGFETDLALIRQLGKAAAFVAGFGVAIPFVLGLAVGGGLPAQFLPDDQGRLVFALFVAAALSISSLPVIAKILGELGLTRRNFGQITLAAGMANDVAGWLILGVIAGIAREGHIEVGQLAVSVGGMALFLAFAFTAGQRLVDSLLRAVRSRRAGIDGAFSVTLLVAFACGTLTQALGVEAILGAFIAGIVLGRSKFQDGRVIRHIESVTLSLLAPLYFATAGLRVDLGLLGHTDVLVVAAVVIAVASIGKFAGAYAGGRLARLHPKEGLALGVALNARGALEIVIATVGLSLGVLNPTMYTVIVLMAIVTSVAAPPLLRLLAAGWAGTPEEQQRLEVEETLRTNVFVRPNRLLVPAQRGNGSELAARIVDGAWPEGVEASLVSTEPDGAVATDRLAGLFYRRPVEQEQLASDDPVAGLVNHMALSYGAVAMGAEEARGQGGLLSPLTAGLLAQTSLPVVLVWGGERAKVHAVAGFRRILVPVVGTLPNRCAQELAGSLAATSGAHLFLLHVAEPTPAPAVRSGGRTRTAARPTRSGKTLAEGIVADAADLARSFGVDPEMVVVEHGDRAESIVDVARDVRADLIVLSAELQLAAGDTFLGNLVEQVVESTPGTDVAVVAAPIEWLASARPE